MKRLLFFLFATLLVVRSARADTPTFVVQADPQLEVGANGTLKIQVNGKETADDPQLAATSNIILASRPSTFLLAIQNQQMMTASWSIRGKAVGTVTVTPSVLYGGKRINGKAVTIKIVPSTGPKPGTSSNPTFQFSFPFPGMIADDDEPTPAPRPTTDPLLALESAPAPTAFIRATIDKKNAVVGEQVILEVELYTEAGIPEPDFTDPHEASTPKFVRHSLMKDDTKQEKLGNAVVGGRIWEVKRIRRAALFPLEAGELQIGAMQMKMISTRGHGVRLSDPLTVHVVEPPAQGRPTGYALGDVGDYTLAAEVSPREVKRGEVVSVRVELAGNGNVPSAIPLPARKGIEWMDSEVHDQVGRVDVDHWGGTKTLIYVVRMLEEGDVALGDIALPVWNPQKNAYDDLRAPLGSIHVLPGTLPADMASAELPPLPPARGSLAGVAARKHLDDSPLFWLGLLAPAAIFASATGARTAMRRARERLSARAISPERELARRTRDAEDACTATDARAADAAIIRVLEQAVIAKRAVNVRGVTKDEAVRALEKAGTKAEIARELTSVLRECEEARFSMSEEGMEPARERWSRARKAMESL
jgi:hypothetical protein